MDRALLIDLSVLFVLILCIPLHQAECPNACSSHGRCGGLDICVCYQKWMGNDCSERICQFGLAHVDSAKGDLDSSGEITGPSRTVVINSQMYPYGTEEQFPQTIDTKLNVLSNTAHYPMECSNKGLCDRSSGNCNCFEGYSGSACQRASCPSSDLGLCSGHGTCETIKKLAKLDFDNIYNLWDEHITMGCLCDGGYTGPDCSQRYCKFGVDPLYASGYPNIRYANFTFEIYTKEAVTIRGNYTLQFVDHTGESWETNLISISATCDELTNVIEALPNSVFPTNSVKCYQHKYYTSANVPIYHPLMYIGGYPQSSLQHNSHNYSVPKYTLAFPKNAGYFPQFRINQYRDGRRPTLKTPDNNNNGTAHWHIFANGFSGEDSDFVPDLCEGVLVTLSTSGTTAYTHSLQGLTVKETRLLKRCLGDSDGNSANNVELYNWDYGYGYGAKSASGAPITTLGPEVPIQWINSTRREYVVNSYQNPHLIKLVDATQETSSPLGGAVDPYPKTKLCSNASSSVPGYGKGWCSNSNPPGFLAVLFFDGVNFNLFTRAATDYSSSTNFHVFTTTGFLRRVSPIADAFSFSSLDSVSKVIDSMYSNVMHLQNSTYLSNTYFGNVDCETNPMGFNGAVDCLDKGDYVMFLNVDVSVAGLAANPIYPNIYKVMKIGREPKDPSSGNQNSEKIRHQIVLDYGVNAAYAVENGNPTSAFSLGSTNKGLVTAAVYKFYPPSGGGYTYVGQCSNRGVCDDTTGICNCFAGYTGDDCGTIDTLIT